MAMLDKIVETILNLDAKTENQDPYHLASFSILSTNSDYWTPWHINARPRVIEVSGSRIYDTIRVRNRKSFFLDARQANFTACYH